QLRSSLKSLMDSQGLSARRWAKQAAVPESAIRNFLTGRSNTLTHITLLALAAAAQVPLGALVGGTEDWGRTETIYVGHSVSADERPGRSKTMARRDHFSIRIPTLDEIKLVEKLGALIEDDSANKIWPKGTVLIYA